MNNEHFSRILTEIAQLSQIMGENRFKIRAFENAAHTINNLGEPLVDYIKAETLTDIPGIGKSLAKDLREIHETGASSYHQELLEALDPGLLDMLKIQGLGPKRVKAIYDALGVSNLDSLQAAAEAQEIQKLPGLGKKTEQNILKEIERLRAFAGRTPLPVARRVAESIRERLSALESVSRVEIAGSIRRELETIGDIDLLVETDAGAHVTEVFSNLPEVKEILASGESKTSVRLYSGIQVDMRLIPAASFGAALHYFTGSKEHHLALRSRAKRQGLKVSEYGVFNEGEDAPLAAKTEEALYQALDLPLIPAELRQGLDEIELAEKNELPELIEAQDIRGDLHMHTTESDGRATILEMAEAAKALGYQYIALTDHSQVVTVANGMTPERFEAHIKRIRQANEEIADFEILAGIEVDILKDGSLDMDADLLKECDWVVASVHTYFNMTPEEMTERLLTAMQTGLICEMGHPTGRILGGRDGYAYDFDAVFRLAAELNIALELNGSTERLDLNAEHARRAKQLGARLALGSDAHSTGGLSAIRYALGQARRAGLQAPDVINTLSAKELLAQARPTL